MPRLFTAIELSPATREAVAAQQADVARALKGAGGASLRPVRAEQLHLTLVFVGEVPEPQVHAIQGALTPSFTREPFELAFGGFGVFPDRGPARVLWLGLQQGAPEVLRLFEEVSDRLVGVGVPRERRPFRPHLTVGRWPERGPAATRLTLPDTGVVAVEQVTAVTLFESRLLPRGAEHTALVRAHLAGARAGLH
ncbi:MAG: RNA 2',3'-cyclic phosphodiesterase [Vicinamibacterales bacterium]